MCDPDLSHDHHASLPVLTDAPTQVRACPQRLVVMGAKPHDLNKLSAAIYLADGNDVVVSDDDHSVSFETPKWLFFILLMAISEDFGHLTVELSEVSHATDRPDPTDRLGGNGQAVRKPAT